jgi:hypothetical protein
VKQTFPYSGYASRWGSTTRLNETSELDNDQISIDQSLLYLLVMIVARNVPERRFLRARHTDRPSGLLAQSMINIITGQTSRNFHWHGSTRVYLSPSGSDKLLGIGCAMVNAFDWWNSGTPNMDCSKFVAHPEHEASAQVPGVHPLE